MGDERFGDTVCVSHVGHSDREIVPRSTKNVWANYDSNRRRGHLVHLFVVRDSKVDVGTCEPGEKLIGLLVEVLDEPFKQIKVRGR